VSSVLNDIRRKLAARVVPAVALVATSLAIAGCGGTGGPSASGSTGSRFDGISASGLTAPNFTLHDQSGALVKLSSERGRYVLLTFLYVHCRNVCPIIADQLNDALRELGPARSDVRVLAISVDPKGDTPAAVHHFITVHHLLPQFLYLTGTAAALKPVWHDYHIASTPTRTGLVVGHTALEILLDRSGRPRLLYDSHVTAHAVVHDLRALGLET